MSCNAAGANCPMASIRRPGKLMDNSRFSDTYRKIKRDGPLASISIHAAAGNPRQGWLTVRSHTIRVALGRGGIIANKRKRDGGTELGTFRRLRLWWRAARTPRPQH